MCYHEPPCPSQIWCIARSGLHADCSYGLYNYKCGDGDCFICVLAAGHGEHYDANLQLCLTF